MAAEVVGAVVERELLDAVFADRAALEEPIARHMSRPLPTVVVFLMKSPGQVFATRSLVYHSFGFLPPSIIFALTSWS